jgi:hypothetical protein
MMMSEIKMCLMTQCESLTFTESMMKKRWKRKFIKGCLWSDLSIELFVDNILDNLQWREVELWHFRLDAFIEDYFGMFILDLVDTIVHEYIHYFERNLPEKQVNRISELVIGAMASEVVSPPQPNLIFLNCVATKPTRLEVK